MFLMPQSINCPNRYILGGGQDKRGASPNYQLDQKLRIFKRFPSVLSKCWRNYSIYDPARARAEINSIFNWDMSRLECCKFGPLHINQNSIAYMVLQDEFRELKGLISYRNYQAVSGKSILYSFNRLHPLLSDHIDLWIIFTNMTVIATTMMSVMLGHLNDKKTYKRVSIWSIVSPFVSGKQKYVQMVATIIHAAKKNHVPYPKELKIYGRALVMANWVSH